MAERNEIGVVYVAGLIQGVAFVTFPAASSILTSPDHYGLSSAAYGVLFRPQAVIAIAFYQMGYGLAAFGSGPCRTTWE